MPKRNLNLVNKLPYVANTVDDEKVMAGFKHMLTPQKSVPIFGKSMIDLDKRNVYGLPRFLLVFFKILSTKL